MLNLGLCDQLTEVEIEVIRVTYLGSYPAIGIRYLNDPKADLVRLLKRRLIDFWKDKVVLDFAEFLSVSGVSWSEVTKKLLSEGD